MAKRRKPRSPTKESKAKSTQEAYKENLKTKGFRKAFKPTGELITVFVKSCVWNDSLADTLQSVIQIGFDSFLAVNYQDEEKPWMRYIFLRHNIELHEDTL